jgi:hypothetical protein
MSGPPYHLRKNKAADRFALIEAIRRLPNLDLDLNDYCYISLGGPYLEDMRQIYEFCPEIRMISIERSGPICSRQRFHMPCRNIEIMESDISSFITTFNPEDKCIFWLDFNGLEMSNFDDFIRLLPKVFEGSLIKITLRANPFDYWVIPHNRKGIKKKREKIPEFRNIFERILPHPDDYPSWQDREFANLLKQMLRIAVNEALPPEANELTFIPISSFYYADTTPMFTLTGIVWPIEDIGRIRDVFQDWEFADLTWDNDRKPIEINIPDLSAKERLHLQEFLPCNTERGDTLRSKLGHLIHDRDDGTTERALEQYAAFHRYFPYFLRGVP